MVRVQIPARAYIAGLNAYTITFKYLSEEYILDYKFV
jgi:hypothetical protein